MDAVTSLLISRPDVLRDILKAFGWRYQSARGWVCDVYTEGHSRLAILDKRTLSWRVGPKGRRDTWRGWLSESFRWCTRARGIPDSKQYEEVARIIQCITGPWPELQAACDEQGHAEVVPNGTPLQASSRMDGEHSGMNECSDNHVFKIEHQPNPVNIDHLKQSTKPNVREISRRCSVSNQFVSNRRAERVSTVDTSEACEQVSLNDTQAEDGVITVITQQPRPLLECHGWPYEPDQAPNVVPFLRPWRGPRGDGGAA